MLSPNMISPAQLRRLEHARDVLRELMGELRDGSSPQQRRREAPRAHEPELPRRVSDVDAALVGIAGAAGADREVELGHALADGAAAVCGARGAATMCLDGRAELVELAGWPEGVRGRPTGQAWSIAERSARTGMPGVGGHPPEAVAAAPVERCGKLWAVVVCWGLADPEEAVGRLAALLALAAPTVSSTLERINLAERSREESALRRIATAVASDRDQPGVNAMIAEEVATLLDAESGSVILIEPDGRARLGAAYARPRRAARSEDAVSRVLRSERPARSEGSSFAAGWIAGDHGIAAPIRVQGLVRGVVTVERNEGGPFPVSTEDRLVPFAELASIAIQNAERSEALSAEARADELTGVGNRRAFTERLAEEVERARRYGHALSLVLMDLDRFKAVNDTFGHQVGDDVLIEATRRLSRLVRTGELVARIGGDEIAWLLPETDVDGALRAAERALDAISREPFETAGAISASAGVSDLAAARSPSELVRLADEALLTAKHDGPGVVRRVV